MPEVKTFVYMDNVDIELTKIQLLSDYYQQRFNSLFSYISQALIGTILVTITLYYERVINIFNFSIIVIILTGVFFLAFRWIGSDYSNNIKNLAQLMAKVEKGEPLPSLEKLMKFS